MWWLGGGGGWRAKSIFQGSHTGQSAKQREQHVQKLGDQVSLVGPRSWSWWSQGSLGVLSQDTPQFIQPPFILGNDWNHPKNFSVSVSL